MSVLRSWRCQGGSGCRHRSPEGRWVCRASVVERSPPSDRRDLSSPVATSSESWKSDGVIYTAAGNGNTIKLRYLAVSYIILTIYLSQFHRDREWDVGVLLKDQNRIYMSLFGYLRPSDLHRSDIDPTLSNGHRSYVFAIWVFFQTGWNFSLWLYQKCLRPSKTINALRPSNVSKLDHHCFR